MSLFSESEIGKMSFHSQSRILELEKIAEGAREQLETLAVRSDDIQRLVESNGNDEVSKLIAYSCIARFRFGFFGFTQEIEKLKEQLSSLKFTSHAVRYSFFLFKAHMI